MSLGPLLFAKELEETYQPLLLCEFTFIDGTVLRVSTHPLSAFYGGVQFGGHNWDPRVLNQEIGALQAMSDVGVDVIPNVTVVLADPDKVIFNNYEYSGIGFKGAKLKLYQVMQDVGSSTASFTSDNPWIVKFIGTVSSPSSDDRTITVTATSLLNMSQIQMPPLRVQPFCGWSFPQNFADRSASVNDSSSPFFQCAYSPDIPGGVGNYQSGTAAFASCTFDFSACIDRLGDKTSPIPILQDKSARRTGRFGGFRYVPNPNSGLERPYITGKWEQIINASTETRYGDFVSMAYGQTWIQPMVMGIFGDGNYTRIEVLLSYGQVSRINKVLVNGYEVQQLAVDYSAPEGNFIPSDSTTSEFKNGDWVTVNNGARNGRPYPGPGWGSKGDPYGSMSTIHITVLRQVAAESSVPSIQILLQGQSIRMYSDPVRFDMGFTRNPAWILLDLLTWATWRYTDIDIQSFIDAAAKCDEQMFFVRMDGTFANFYNDGFQSPYQRFTIGIPLREQTPTGDLIRGIRNAMKGMLFFDYKTGLLKLVIKETAASQQPNVINGSNLIVAIPSVTVEGIPQTGYAAYSFDESNILKDDNGRLMVSIAQLSNQDAPNKSTSVFQNRENTYSQDSATIIDVEDVSRLGFDIVGSFTLAGPQTYDHVRRVTNTWFAENYRGNNRLDYTGSAIGDTGGTMVFTLTTSIKAVHLSIGQICVISLQQLGISFQPVRVTRVQPSSNFETCQVTLNWHNDNWYQNSFGQVNQPKYARVHNLIERVPFAWRPDYEVPIKGDALYDPTDHGFGVQQFYDTATDGTLLAHINIAGKLPINSFPTVPARPRLELTGIGSSAALGPGTTSFSPGKTYYAALAARTDDTTATLLSAVSKPSVITLDANSNALQLAILDWPDNPSGFFAFAGETPFSMTFQEAFDTNPTAVVINNHPYNIASWEAPDEAFTNFRWRVNLIRHSGVFGINIVGATTASIQVSTYKNWGFETDQWAGRVISVLGIDSVSGSLSFPFIPIANFPISGNNEDTLFLSAGDPTTCVGGDSLKKGDAVVMRFQPIYGEDTIGKYFEDPLLINHLDFLGFKWKITGVTNSSPITITLEDYAVFPFSIGNTVVVQGVQGNTAANGGWIAANPNPTAGTVQLVGSSGNGAWTGGGTIAKQFLGLTEGAETGQFVFIVAGTGRGTRAKILKNNATRIWIDGDWPVQPDSTSVLIIINPTPIFDFPSDQVSCEVPQTISYFDLDIHNFPLDSLLIRGSTQSISRQYSPEPLDPFREIFTFGPKNILKTSNAPSFLVQDQGYALLTIVNVGLVTSANVDQIQSINFFAPSIDETDVGFWGFGSIDGTSDPVVFTPTLFGSSRFGLTFGVGDYILWFDQNTTDGKYQFEIDQISGKSGGAWTLSRTDAQSKTGEALFGSPMTAHTGKQFYRLVKRTFSAPVKAGTSGTTLTDPAIPPMWEWAWANKCVAAVVGQTITPDGPSKPQTLNLAPLPTDQTPPAPGHRTMNGAAYTTIGISGSNLVSSLALNQRSDRTVKFQSWESLRVVYGELGLPATGAADYPGLLGDAPSAAAFVYVLYIEPLAQTIAAGAGSSDSQRRVGLLEQLVFGSGNQYSFPTGTNVEPASRQMPYNRQWPPTELIVVGTKGSLTLPFVDGGDRTYIHPDGDIDLIVAQIGSSTQGGDLRITVQT